MQRSRAAFKCAAASFAENSSARSCSPRTTWGTKFSRCPIESLSIQRDVCTPPSTEIAGTLFRGARRPKWKANCVRSGQVERSLVEASRTNEWSNLYARNANFLRALALLTDTLVSPRNPRCRYVYSRSHTFMFPQAHRTSRLRSTRASDERLEGMRTISFSRLACRIAIMQERKESQRL